MSADGPPTCRIFYSCNSYPADYVDCAVTRWQENNDSLVIETFLSSSNRGKLFHNVVPGAVRELYSILGVKKFIDTTYASSNTYRVTPNYQYGLSGLRQERIIAVKNISDTFINKDVFNVKIEGIMLD